MTTLDRLTLLIRCPRCRVRPGRWCVTDLNREAEHLHAGRADPIHTVYAAGYEAGHKQGRADELSAVTALMATAVRHPSSTRATDPWRA